MAYPFQIAGESNRHRALEGYAKMMAGIGWLFIAVAIVAVIVTAVQAGELLVMAIFGGLILSVGGAMMIVLGQAMGVLADIETNTQRTFLVLAHQADEAVFATPIQRGSRAMRRDTPVDSGPANISPQRAGEAIDGEDFDRWFKMVRLRAMDLDKYDRKHLFDQYYLKGIDPWAE